MNAALQKLDRQARRIARTVFDRPVVIEAGAGTGKTTILVNRVLSWCLGPGWEERAQDRSSAEATVEEIAGRVCERVVAITFTEAAAAEMAQRIAEELVRIDRGEESSTVVIEVDLEASELQRRARALHAQVHRLRVSTIHAFCTSIMRRFPVECSVDPGFSVDTDGLMVAAAVQEVIEEDLRKAEAGANHHAWKVLVRAGQTPTQVAMVLARLISKGLHADHLAASAITEEVALSLESRFAAACRAVDALVAGRLDVQNKARTARDTALLVHYEVERLDEVAGEEQDPLVRLQLCCDRCVQLHQEVKKRLKLWAEDALGKAEAALMGEDRSALQAAAAELSTVLDHLRRIRPVEFAAAIDLLQPLMTGARQRLRAQGRVTYDDLLEGAHRLLVLHPDARGEIRRGISQLLVDEFQDTDSSQCEIVWLLALGEPDETGPRPGLFIVGDPKQSIYGWRSADLEAYMHFVERLRELGAEVHPLAVNFRSVPAILDEVERVVSQVMVEERGLQPPFQQLLASDANQDRSGFQGGGRAPVEYWITAAVDPETGALDKSFRVDDAVVQEAEAVAEDILDLHQQHGVAWGAVGVLLRGATKLKLLLDSFRKHGIPFEVAKDREYYRQREVVEAAALVRLVIEPGDQLALLTVLRSDVVGVPDAALQPLWDLGLPALVFDLDGPDTEQLERLEEVIVDAGTALAATTPGLDRVPRWQAALSSAVESIAVLRQSLRDDPAAVFVEHVRTLWCAEITAAARYLGDHRLARLRSFYGELERSLAARDGGPWRVARLLRQAVEGELPVQAASSPDSAADAVVVSTIHGAKGLDFDHVYVLNMAAASGGGGRPLTEAISGENGVEISVFGWAGPGLAAAEERVSRREAAEMVRLLYVAMTRAKQRLVLSGSLLGRSGGKVPAQTMMALLGDRVPTMATEEFLKEQRWRFHPPGDQAQRVLTAYREPPPAVQGQDPERSTTLQSVSPHDRMLRLQQARDAAAHQMERSFSAGVSALSHSVFDGEQDAVVPRADHEVVDRGVATAVGTALHKILEDLDLGRDPAEQLHAALAAVLESGALDVHGSDLDEARSRLSRLVEVLVGGACLRRLAAVGESGVVARELPMVLPPLPDQGPVGCMVGFADLVYSDPETGELVVADYKTDAVSDDERIAARTKIYEIQIRTYARGLAEAMGLKSLPRCELWFLAADRIVIV